MALDLRAVGKKGVKMAFRSWAGQSGRCHLSLTCFSNWEAISLPLRYPFIAVALLFYSFTLLPAECCQPGCNALFLAGPDALCWMKEKPDIREIGFPEERTHRNFLEKKKGMTK